ncbi:4Fe-4S dicluster domain-containing protein [Fulvivirga sp. RKSG066]|uniref:4Fe-4S binding protein n=1 Tax=Fulvivirga aurantia TaxID=2529383 RepID=UPI0012BD2273|nr:4Fe-4S binding protein [Fulvivirga aurantia]MTI21578.1 4Fe-4S dicluster domain-containing protein [Fulvivirga aurantia]
MSTNYWLNIKSSTKTLLKGLSITLRHFFDARHSKASIDVKEENYFEKQNGISTIQYPHESMPVPDNGRYRLHNEIDDCIVCDKCAKICPVDCIEIESIKATETFGKTSDGTPKRIHAAKFDIDMGKCCFCGLCTTVCPTECLTMTKTFDFSEFEIDDHVYSFANMSAADILAKQKELAAYEEEKAKAKESKGSSGESPRPKPVAKPKTTTATTGKPKFKPRAPKPKKKDD